MHATSTRLATSRDAPAAVQVLRRSITELCVADHQNDAPTLERWLLNKTTEHFERWCAGPDSRLVVAERNSAIAGVAALHQSGEVRLLYVSPDFAGLGIGKALLRTLEDHARAWNLATLELNSTLTARRFYERCGFASAGDDLPAFGIVRGYPYSKKLTR